MRYPPTPGMTKAHLHQEIDRGVGVIGARSRWKARDGALRLVPQEEAEWVYARVYRDAPVWRKWRLRRLSRRLRAKIAAAKTDRSRYSRARERAERQS